MALQHEVGGALRAPLTCPLSKLIILCDFLVGDSGRSELVDTSIGAEEQRAMMNMAYAEEGATANGDMEVDQPKEGKPVEVEVKVPEEEAEPEPEWVVHLRAIDVILSGSKTIALHQEFLIRNNNCDLQILKNTKVQSAAFTDLNIEPLTELHTVSHYAVEPL